jgi:hypothetical protein
MNNYEIGRCIRRLALRTAPFDTTFDTAFLLPIYRRHRRALLTITRFLYGDTRQLRAVATGITISAVSAVGNAAD